MLRFRNFHILLTLLFKILAIVSGKACPGKCLPDVESCKREGGKIVGYCTNEGACCDLSEKQIGSCGAKINGSKVATFQSPLYPTYVNGGFNCEFKFEIGDQPHTGILIDFLDFDTEEVGFGLHPSCDADMIFIQGFKDWMPPPRCGNLTGYSTLIDVTEKTRFDELRILAVMSSLYQRWKIQVSLINSKRRFGESEPNTKEKPNIAEALIEDADNSDSSSPIIEYPLIVNGKDTNVTKVPWQVSIRTFYTESFLTRSNYNASMADEFNREQPQCELEGRHFCGGSIISNRHILTAAHCFASLNKMSGWKSLETVKVFVGETSICENDVEKYGRKSQNFSIEKIYFHYGYSQQHFQRDMVVLKLKGKIQFNSYIKPIALTKRNKTFPGKTALASGWGLTNLTAGNTPNNSLPLVLQSAELIVENETVCSKHLAKGFFEVVATVMRYPTYADAFASIVCTKSNTSSFSKMVGQGDSGGPLVIYDDALSPPLPTLIGVTSFGLDALDTTNITSEHANRYVDFFQDVSYYRDWIDLAMTL